MNGRRKGAVRRELAEVVLSLCCTAGLVLGLLRAPDGGSAAAGGAGRDLGDSMMAGAEPMFISAGQGLFVGFVIGALLALAIVGLVPAGRRAR